MEGENPKIIRLKDYFKKHPEKEGGDSLRLVGLLSKKAERVPFTKEDLRFLYEIDRRILVDGEDMERAIGTLRDGRNARADLVTATGLRPNEISLTEEEVFKGGSKFHFGNIYLADVKLPQDFHLPEQVRGSIQIGDVEDDQEVTFPKKVIGDLLIERVESMIGRDLPQYLEGTLYIGGLKQAGDLHLPAVFIGDLHLPSLINTKHFKMPKGFRFTLFLDALATISNVDFLKEFSGGKLYAPNIVGYSRESIQARGYNFELIDMRP